MSVERVIYDIALRPDEPGGQLLDDIVVRDVELFRAEQMDTGEWWVRCYLRGGTHITFAVYAGCRPRRIEWTVTEMPDGDFRYEPQKEVAG